MWAKPGTREGLRIRGARGHPVVRRSVVRFAVWLRENYEYPVRVPVYLSPHTLLVTRDGLTCSASFLAPWAPDVEPYIRIATGDYPIERAERGRDDALASYLNSLAHELTHYEQWLQTGRIWERGVRVRATSVLRRYARVVAHP